MSARNTVIFRTQNRYSWLLILNFSSNTFETAEFWRIVGLTAVLRLLQKENINFSLICSFYCCLVKEG